MLLYTNVVFNWRHVLIYEHIFQSSSTVCDVVSVPWSPPQPLPLQPQTRLQWRRCADLPVEMGSAQAVLVGGKVCVGGGDTDTLSSDHLYFSSTTKGGMDGIPYHPVL